MTVQARCNNSDCPFNHERLEKRAKEHFLPPEHPHRYVICDLPHNRRFFDSFASGRSGQGDVFQGDLKKMLDPKRYGNEAKCPGCSSSFGNGKLQLQTIGFCGCRFRIVYQISTEEGAINTVYIPEGGREGNFFIPVLTGQHCTLTAQPFRNFHRLRSVNIEMREWPMGLCIHGECDNPHCKLREVQRSRSDSW